MHIQVQKDITFNKVVVSSLGSVTLGSSAQSIPVKVQVLEVRVQALGTSVCTYTTSTEVEGTDAVIGQGTCEFQYQPEGDAILEQAYRAVLLVVGGELVL